jgi:ketosteroid isomerase-like protein
MGNVQILKGAYEAFGHGDIPSVLATFDPNIEWREAEGNPYKPDGKPWIGGDAIAQNLFMRLGSEWDGFTVTPKEFHDAGDTVVVECRYTGVHNATGKRIDAQACHVWKLSDGKAKSFQQYVDTAQMQDAMGTREAQKVAEASVA